MSPFLLLVAALVGSLGVGALGTTTPTPKSEPTATPGASLLPGNICNLQVTVDNALGKMWGNDYQKNVNDLVEEVNRIFLESGPRLSGSKPVVFRVVDLRVVTDRECADLASWYGDDADFACGALDSANISASKAIVEWNKLYLEPHDFCMAVVLTTKAMYAPTDRVNGLSNPYAVCLEYGWYPRRPDAVVSLAGGGGWTNTAYHGQVLSHEIAHVLGAEFHDEEGAPFLMAPKASEKSPYPQNFSDQSLAKIEKNLQELSLGLNASMREAYKGFEVRRTWCFREEEGDEEGGMDTMTLLVCVSGSLSLLAFPLIAVSILRCRDKISPNIPAMM